MLRSEVPLPIGYWIGSLKDGSARDSVACFLMAASGWQHYEHGLAEVRRVDQRTAV